MEPRTKLKIKKHHEIRIVRGHPWIFSNEIENFSALKNLEKGAIVEIEIRKNEPFALAYFNPHSLIAARILTYDVNQKIDENFFAEKILAAKILREKFFDKPFYRLIHSEADFLPGLVIDCFGEVLSCQITTAGMEKLSEFLVAALQKIFPGFAIIFRNDVEARRLEGLELYVKGEVADKIGIEENDLKFLVDVKTGQKTGWFFDQRKNREFIGSIAKNCDVLDAFCYLGGFGLNALKNGAKSVTFIDSSKEALDLVLGNIALNNLGETVMDPVIRRGDTVGSEPTTTVTPSHDGVHKTTGSNYQTTTGQNYQTICGKTFEILENPDFQKNRFDLVLLDPPAFIKSKKDFFPGLKGYEKLVKLSANLVRKNGFLMLSSCSHNASLSDLISAANDGLRKAGCRAKLIRSFGADIDHPVHPALKESEYLKSITFQIL